MNRLWLLTLLPLTILAFAVWLVKYVWAIVFSPQHAKELAVSIDQLANTALNGSMDETISSRAQRHSQQDSDRECWAVWLCWLLDKIDPNHCEKSKGV